MADASGHKDRTALLNDALVALERMQAKVSIAEEAMREPLAVIGMGCRWPGSGDSPEEYWDMLRSATDAVADVPDERWPVDEFYDPDPNAPGKICTRRAGFIESVDLFDAKRFGISPREAIGIDPQQRIMLEVAWRALESAGIDPLSLKGSNTGVFVGIGSGDYAQMTMESTDICSVDAYTGSGGGNCFAAGRLSYSLGLRGPGMIVDTACSSSSVAVHLACQSLRLGECDLALAGGVNLILSPYLSIYLSRTGALSPDGRCKVFDSSADGFVRGEGCGVIALMRLSDALKQRFKVLAVIRGSAVNQDGASSGLTVPNGSAQRQVIIDALRNADIKPGDVSFVEVHGTGTSLGDPIEVGALTAVLQDGRRENQPLILGGVKANIGHTEAAAGIAGLIKVVLCLQHGEIPRQINFTTLNPHIEKHGVAIQIPLEHMRWDGIDGKRYAGISSFGLSGTNAHIILEAAPDVADTEPVADRTHHILTLSAKSQPALSQLAARYAGHLSGVDAQSLGDICFSANAGQRGLPCRLSLVANSSRQAIDDLDRWAQSGEAPAVANNEFSTGQQPAIAFLFTGQGSQYPGMGRALYQAEPVFRSTFDRCAGAMELDGQLSLAQIIGYEPANTAAGSPALLDETQFTQPALFAYEYALAVLWRSWGITPAAVMGHSLGEYVAACIAGVLTLEDALALVSLRARLMQALPRDGAMVAVMADEQKVRSVIEPFAKTVAISAVNTTENTVISGRDIDIETLAKRFSGQGIEIRPLAVSHAFHSPLIEPMLDEFEKFAGTVRYAKPEIMLASNLHGTICDDSVSLDGRYWRDHARETVRFADSIRELHEKGIRTFVEVGPAPVLIGMASQCVDDSSAGWFASARKDRDEWQQMLSSLGQIFVRGATPNWQSIDKPFRHRRRHLPRTPFNRKRFWQPDTPSSIARVKFEALPPAADHYPLLGYRVSSPLREIQFACDLSTSAYPVLGEHRIAGLTVLPAAAFVELGHSAAKSIFDSSAVRLENCWLRNALLLEDQAGQDIRFVVTPVDADSAEFEVFSRLANVGSRQEWTTHAGGRLLRGNLANDPAPSCESLRGRCSGAVNLESYRQKMEEAGLEFGPSFRALVEAFRGARESFGKLTLPAEDRLADKLGVHPGMLDSAFHLIGLALAEDEAVDRFYLPVGFEAASVFAALGSEAFGHARIRSVSALSIIADVNLWRTDGSLAASVYGLEVRPVSREQFRAVIGGEQAGLLRPAWPPARESVPAVPKGSWHLLGGDAQFIGLMIDEIRQRNASAVAIHEQNAESLIRQLQTGEVRDIGGIIDLRNLDLQPVQGIPDSGLPTDGFSDSPVAQSLKLLSALASAPMAKEYKILIATRHAQKVLHEDPVCPMASVVWGIAKSASIEVPNADIRLLDVDSKTLAAAKLVDTALRQDNEACLALRSDSLYAARLTGLDDVTDEAMTIPNGAYALSMPGRGTLGGLAVESVDQARPGPGQVEIEVLASGLNFRDILNLLDMYPGTAGALGNECSGRILSVGADVVGMRAGMLVTCLAEATFGSHVVVDAGMTFPMPASLSIVQAAVFPMAQLTAYLALHNVGGIAEGDRVLIHAGAGGVGLAAVHLALAAGAQVLATAGSDRKRQMLLQLGVHSVFDSRTTLEAETVLDATDGHGVDLLLNSLIGDFVDEGLRALAPGGHFLEIGLRDIRAPDNVREIRNDISYDVLMLGDFCREDPAMVRRMYNELIELLEADRIPPPRVKTFPISAAESAFRYMAQARHIGRIAIIHPTVGRSAIRADASYVVTGGLGALGLHISEWMARRGARHIVLLGRNPPSSDAQQRIQALVGQGVQIDVRLGDVGVASDLSFLRQRDGPPLRGVIHAAGVLDDAGIADLDADRLRQLMRPKADGVCNLHRATSNLDLDFFVLFSSGSAIFGSPGQAAYAGSNAYLDGFAHYLRGEGLCVLSVNWGAWRDGGMAATVDKRIVQDWDARGIRMMTATAATAALEKALGSGLSQVAIQQVDWAKYLSTSPGSASPALLSDLGITAAHGDIQDQSVRITLLETLKSLPAKQQLRVLTERLQEEAAAVLGMDPEEIELRDGLTEQGMDSLMAVELAGRLSNLLGVGLPTTFTFDYPTIGALARYFNQQLGSAEATADLQAKQQDKPDVAEEIGHLSESELEAVLRSEIETSELRDEQK